MPKPNSPRVLPPIRVRQEPPTVEEAIVAAQSLTADPGAASRDCRRVDGPQRRGDQTLGADGTSSDVEPLDWITPRLHRNGYRHASDWPGGHRATIAAADHCAESAASDGADVQAGLKN